MVDTGTALWYAGTHSPHAPYTGCVQYPGSYKCTLKGKEAKMYAITMRPETTLTCNPFFSVNMSLTPAVAPGSVPEVAALADATVWSLGVVKTFPALSGLSVTRTHV